MYSAPSPCWHFFREQYYNKYLGVLKIKCTICNTVLVEFRIRDYAENVQKVIYEKK